MNAYLKDMLSRVEKWSDADQEELAQAAFEIEARRRGAYQPSPEELAGIDRGLKAASEGRFVAEHEVETAFAKFRKA